jgi:hypothetical protein
MARLAYGGIPQAIGKGLTVLRAKNPEAGDLVTSIFDSLSDRAEQRRIQKHA